MVKMNAEEERKEGRQVRKTAFDPHLRVEADSTAGTVRAVLGQMHGFGEAKFGSLPTPSQIVLIVMHQTMSIPLIEPHLFVSSSPSMLSFHPQLHCRPVSASSLLLCSIN